MDERVIYKQDDVRLREFEEKYVSASRGQAELQNRLNVQIAKSEQYLLKVSALEEKLKVSENNLAATKQQLQEARAQIRGSSKL